MFRKSIIKHLLKSLGYDKKNIWINKLHSYTHLNRVNADRKATTKTYIAGTLGETFCHNLSSFNYPNLSERRKTNKKKLN